MFMRSLISRSVARKSDVEVYFSASSAERKWLSVSKENLYPRNETVLDPSNKRRVVVVIAQTGLPEQSQCKSRAGLKA